MTQAIARYTVTFGLTGCYLPDSVNPPVELATRAELAQFIRDELAFYDMPACLFREVHIRRLWRFIQFAGSSSSAHFSLSHKAVTLSFHGLTEEEFSAQSDDEV
jgi:hypothetical protein